MSTLNIVLHEPEIPQNTGNIARTCAVTGARLHLIRPLGFTIDDKKLKRSGLDYWEFLEIYYYDNIDDFLKKNPNPTCFYFSTKANKSYVDNVYSDDCFLFFGKETAGLPEELLFKNERLCVRIPMMDESRSLNLSNAVAIATYEVLRQWNFPLLKTKGELTKFKWSESNL